MAHSDGPTDDDGRSALSSYRVLFERAALTAQLADDERLHRMLDALLLFGLVTDANGDITYMNSAMRDRLGLRLDEVVGHGVFQDLPEHAQLRDAIMSAISTGHLAPEWVTQIPLRDGTTLTVRWTSTFIRDNDGRIRALTSVGEDLSELEPEQVVASSNMESLGRLAGGIAHDFNNYLAVIGGHTDLTRFTPGLPAAARPHLDQIDVATQRATELIRQLLSFGRQNVPDPVTISLFAELSELVALIRPTFRSSIGIQVVANTTDDLVKFDRSRLDQIFVNLAFNSRDAMPHGGDITYSVGCQDLDATRAGDLNIEPGPYVVVTVADDGPGIDPDIIDHVFERHVSTKPPGEGHGLGLATVLGVITQAGGAIEIDRDRTAGTAFALYFRRVTGEPG